MDLATNIGLVLLGLVVGVVALIGILDIVRISPIKAVRALGDADPPAVTDPRFLETAELLSRINFQPGHQVELMICGDETYPCLWDDLRSAKQSITIQQ